MKKIFLICLSAGFISAGFAQSSVADVPENKIKPAYENAAATKSQAVLTPQKAVAPQPVLNSAGLNAHDQPNLQPAPVAKKPVEVTKAEPAASLRLVSTSATKQDMPPTDQKQAMPTAPVSTKPVYAENIDKTIPGTLVATPAVNVSTGSSVQSTVVPATTSKMPEQKITQDVQKVEEVPASVAPTAPKMPAASKQGGK